MVRTRPSAIEKKCEVKIDVTHSAWPWSFELAGFLITRFEVGRDGKTVYERLKGTSAQRYKACQFAEGILWTRRRPGDPLGKLACMWGDGVYLGINANTGGGVVGTRMACG